MSSSLPPETDPNHAVPERQISTPLPFGEHPTIRALVQFATYYDSVIGLALRESLAFFKLTMRGVTTGVILFAIFLVLSAWLAPQVFEAEVTKKLIVILAFLAGFAVLLVVNFARAPYMLDLIREMAAQQAGRDLKAAQVEFETQKNLVERYKHELRTANDKKLTLESRADLLERKLAQATIDNSGLHARLAKLSERLLPKFQILFEDEPPFVQRRSDLHVIRLGVFNDSAKSIESVTAYVETFEAYGSVFKDIPLPIMNDDSRPLRKHFSLHPDSKIFVDLAMKDVHGSLGWRLLNAYEGHRHIETRETDVTICVVVTGFNAVPAKRRFRLHVDSDGVLQCEPLDPVETITLPVNS